ncbi:redoxin domain-containing protein [Lentibacillus sp. N15]|uniref:redoxin domain-containing protein n=1 Tax=Lentibacillus songyuanensis TaxID=3136161 RepID=UPI0031BA41B7
MKKAIIIVVLVGMFGWAVYDFAGRSNDTTNSEQEQINHEEESDHTKAEDDNHTNGDDEGSDYRVADDTITPDNAKVGLEQGDAAPDFELQTLNGEKSRLSDYRGQRVLLNFWATWCPPCRAEIPDLEKFYKNNDVVVLSVDLTETESNLDEVKNFADEFDMTYPVLLDEHSKVASVYGIQPIPTSYMIDSDGIIQNKAFGALTYDMMVEGLERMQ